MSVCFQSQPSCHALLKFAGYSNLLNEDILKMSNLKLSQPGVEVALWTPKWPNDDSKFVEFLRIHILLTPV